MKKPVATIFKSLILFTALFFTACSKNSDPTVSGNKYYDAKGTYVIITASDWYLTKQGTGGSVSLKLAGTTNADKVTLTTSGDGLLSDYNIALSGSQFSTDTGISFTANSVPTGTFQSSTTLKAYKGTDTLVVKLTSGNLQY